MCLGDSASRDVARAPPRKTEEQSTRFRSQFLKTEFCRFHSWGKCRNGAKCPFAHGPTELQHRPDLAKTSLCRLWLEGKCDLSPGECQFAHGSIDLRTTELYKQIGGDDIDGASRLGQLPDRQPPSRLNLDAALVDDRQPNRLDLDGALGVPLMGMALQSLWPLEGPPRCAQKRQQQWQQPRLQLQQQPTTKMQQPQAAVAAAAAPMQLQVLGGSAPCLREESDVVWAQSLGRHEAVLRASENKVVGPTLLQHRSHGQACKVTNELTEHQRWHRQAARTPFCNAPTSPDAWALRGQEIVADVVAEFPELSFFETKEITPSSNILPHEMPSNVFLSMEGFHDPWKPNNASAKDSLSYSHFVPMVDEMLLDKDALAKALENAMPLRYED